MCGGSGCCGSYNSGIVTCLKPENVWAGVGVVGRTYLSDAAASFSWTVGVCVNVIAKYNEETV